MKEKSNDYLLLLATSLCLFISLTIIVYFNIEINSIIKGKSYNQLPTLHSKLNILTLVIGAIFILLIVFLTKILINKRDLIKEKQDVQEYDKLKTEFFANISHEFKTPLNIIMGSMQLLELYASNGMITDTGLKLDKYLKIMKQNSLRLLRLINNLIDLTKIDSDYFYIEFHNYDIVAIVEGIVQSINMYAKVKKVSITFKKEIEQQIIACDADKIERILLNLLSNALKFTNENGNIEVKVGVHNNSVFISVKDDGIGIQQEQLELIFERFRQVDKSFTRNREGSGIGLSLVKALVDMHKGNITVNSQLGKGTEFIVELPIDVIEGESRNEMLPLYEDGREERLRIELSDI